MDNVKGMLVSHYAPKITGIYDSINIEMDGYQSTLEELGFKVKRFDNLVNFDAAQSLTAEKGNVVLKASRFVRGGKTFSIMLNHGGHEKTMNLYSNKFKDALAAVNAAQYLAQ